MRKLSEISILIVEDEPDLRKAIVYDFKKLGYNVTDTENGKNAFEIVKKNKVDIVLTDVRMPGGDGIELLDNIKNKNPELPVVMFITGFADISPEDAFDKGVDAIFSKPFNRKELFAAVERAVKEKEEQWSTRSDRFTSDFDIELEFEDFNYAVQGRVLNIGRGGVFVAHDGILPRVGSLTQFNVSFKQGVPRGIIGQGIVRWVRSPSVPNFQSGCGLEFQYLDDSTRTQLIDLIRCLNTKSFIPKS